MSGMRQQQTGRQHFVVDAVGLWAGGLATALVSALIAMAGTLATAGLIGVPIIAPKGDGVWGEASATGYALGAAGLSIGVTALLHLLILCTPCPMNFFVVVVGLETFLAMVAPFATDLGLPSKICTCGLNLALGIAMGTLIGASARVSPRPHG
jgi:hypothetical protein